MNKQMDDSIVPAANHTVCSKGKGTI